MNLSVSRELFNRLMVLDSQILPRLIESYISFLEWYSFLRWRYLIRDKEGFAVPSTFFMSLYLVIKSFGQAHASNKKQLNQHDNQDHFMLRPFPLYVQTSTYLRCGADIPCFDTSIF